MKVFRIYNEPKFRKLHISIWLYVIKNIFVIDIDYIYMNLRSGYVKITLREYLTE